MKNDEGKLPWAKVVKNRCFEVGDRDLIWQPLPADTRDAELVIAMQESRILSNYPLLVSRLWRRRKVAYWGHGRNFQSEAPRGLRERWKNLLLTRVDWWFGYTAMTTDILSAAGFPAERITQLDNAIDSGGFKSDLASWSDDDVSAARQRLGVQTGAPVGIFCGSLYPDKLLNLLIGACDVVQAACPKFTLVVIGDGPSMAQMREAAEQRPWVHLLGTQKGRQKALYFRMGDMMLNPGLVGLHIVDAFCAGLVMVTTRGARHSPEVAYLRHGVNGVSCGDTAADYAAAVLELIESPDQLAQLKRHALEDSHRYTLENMVRRFADGIQRALDA